MNSNSSNVLIALLTIVTLVALTGYQVTSETSGVRLLGRLGAALVELDRWLPVHRDDIELQARDRPAQPVVLSDLPVEVAIPASTALDAPDPVVSATIRAAMGQRLYDEGYKVITDEQGKTHLGLTEPLRWSIDALDKSAHGFWRVALVISALALAVTTAVHFWTRQSPLPGIAVGSAIAGVLGLVAWLVVGLIGSSLAGALDQEIGGVARDGLWIGLRNSVAATAIGLGGLYAYNSLVGPRTSDEWDDLDFEYEAFEYEAYEPEPREAPPQEAPPY